MEKLTISEYAERRGITHQAVQKQLKKAVLGFGVLPGIGKVLEKEAGVYTLLTDGTPIPTGRINRYAKKKVQNGII